MKSAMKTTYVKPNHHVEVKKLYLSIDAGSTETRSVENYFDENKEVQSTPAIVIGAEYAKFRRPLQMNTESEPLFKNLEFKIGYPAIEGFSKGEVEQIARAALRDKYRLSGAVESIDSTQHKIEQRATYNTILSSIATQCMVSDMNTGVYSDVYDIDLQVSLPPGEITEAFDGDKFRRVLSNTFDMEMPKIKRAFQIKISSIIISPEPLAAAVNYITSKLETRRDQNILFVECGGRSIGTIMYRGVDKLDPDSAFPKLGSAGDAFLTNLAMDLATKYSITQPSRAQILQSLKTGKYMIGMEELDFISILDECKLTFADNLMSCIRSSMKTIGMNFDELQRIVFSGRIFEPLILKDGTMLSPSLADIFKESQELALKNIEVEKQDTIYPVINGLSILQQSEMLKSVYSNEPDEEDEDSEYESF